MGDLKEVFTKHGMAVIEGLEERSVFGVNEEDKMCVIHNYIQSAYPYKLYGDKLPCIDLNEFAEDSKKALEKLGIKKLTGNYKIYVDDGNTFIIEGGKIIFY